VDQAILVETLNSYNLEEIELRFNHGETSIRNVIKGIKSLKRISIIFGYDRVPRKFERSSFQEFQRLINYERLYRFDSVSLRYLTPWELKSFFHSWRLNKYKKTLTKLSISGERYHQSLDTGNFGNKVSNIISPQMTDLRSLDISIGQVFKVKDIGKIFANIKRYTNLERIKLSSIYMEIMSPSKNIPLLIEYLIEIILTLLSGRGTSLKEIILSISEYAESPEYISLLQEGVNKRSPNGKIAVFGKDSAYIIYILQHTRSLCTNNRNLC
jgi:hypothetical protein